MSTDVEVYLKKHHLTSYIEDSVTLLLEKKEEDPKMKPYEILSDYFECVKKGSHIFFRDYSFVSLTPHNRASFIKYYWTAFSEVGLQVGPMKVMEYLSLIRLLCYNFPSEMTLRVGRAIFSYDVTENKVMFLDFLHTFQIVFYYENFLSSCEHACREIANGQTPLDALNPGEMVVSVPSADQSVPEKNNVGYPMHSSKVALAYDEAEVHIDRHLFLKAIKGLCRKYEKEPWESSPSLSVLVDVIEQMKNITFYNLVLALSRSDNVNREIGILPDRENVSLSGSSETISNS